MISSVGGLKIPPVDAFIAGYQFCAKKVKPSITTLNGYSQDFVAQDKCKEVALQQMGEESDVVFQVAGGCGLGAIQGAKEQKKWGIGVDTDQALPGQPCPDERHEEGRRGRVLDDPARASTKAWKGGVDTLFNVKNKGVGYGQVSKTAPNRAALIGKLNLWSRNLASGKVKPPRTVKG